MFVRMVRRCPEGLFKKTMAISLSRMTLWEEKICSHDDFTSDFVLKINLKSFSWFPPIHNFKNALEKPDLARISRWQRLYSIINDVLHWILHLNCALRAHWASGTFGMTHIDESSIICTVNLLVLKYSLVQVSRFQVWFFRR